MLEGDFESNTLPICENIHSPEFEKYIIKKADDLH